MIDPLYCGDCFETDCFGCEVRNKAYGTESEDTDDDNTGDTDD